jgi:hypothetical protein
MHINYLKSILTRLHTGELTTEEAQLIGELLIDAMEDERVCELMPAAGYDHVTADAMDATLDTSFQDEAMEHLESLNPDNRRV